MNRAIFEEKKHGNTYQTYSPRRTESFSGYAGHAAAGRLRSTGGQPSKPTGPADQRPTDAGSPDAYFT
jgi:hypothetical protein